MNWLVKAAAYKTISALPGGAALYRFIQDRVTQSLVPSRERVSQKIDVGLLYYDWLVKNGLGKRLVEGVHMDFGAGWHPTIPLLYYCMGTNRQHLLDVAPNLDQAMVAETIKVFLAVVSDPQWPHRAKLARLPAPLEDADWRGYLERLGIYYHAPYGDAFTTLAGKVDVVTSTIVLLYVPRAIVPAYLGQIYATLKPGGVLMATVHLRDILAGNPHSSADKYNHLRYSPETWERWFNSSIMHFNRFKARDYRTMLETAGFKVVHFDVEPATAEDYAELDRVQAAPCFAQYSREELAARSLFFVAQKP